MIVMLALVWEGHGNQFHNILGFENSINREPVIVGVMVLHGVIQLKQSQVCTTEHVVCHKWYLLWWRYVIFYHFWWEFLSKRTSWLFIKYFLCEIECLMWFILPLLMCCINMFCKCWIPLCDPWINRTW